MKPRDAVFARDRMSCVMCGGTYSLNLHHRRTRGMGGTKRPESNLPANLLVLCGSGTQGCHGWVTQNPDLARERGYVVRQHADPEQVPVVAHGAWVFLRNDGTADRIDMTCPIQGFDDCTDGTPCIACPRGAA